MLHSRSQDGRVFMELLNESLVLIVSIFHLSLQNPNQIIALFQQVIAG